MSFKTLTLAGVLLVATSVVASATEHTTAPVATGEFDGQMFLMDAQEMTLYTFDKDGMGMSNCYDECAANWPPLMGEAGMDLPEGYSLIERKDGGMQVAYKGQPLYLWSKDEKPGDMMGDGVKGVWRTARP